MTSKHRGCYSWFVLAAAACRGPERQPVPKNYPKPTTHSGGGLPTNLVANGKRFSSQRHSSMAAPTCLNRSPIFLTISGLDLATSLTTKPRDYGQRSTLYARLGSLFQAQGNICETASYIHQRLQKSKNSGSIEHHKP